MDGIQALSNNSSTSVEAGSATGTSGLSINDFYKLLAAQMQYQDADNPMDTSEMMAQMVQTHMIEAITNMSTINTITYASSMVGKEVTMAETDSQGQFTGEHTTGTVSGILMGDNPILYMGDKAYHMAQIMTVGKVPESVIDDGEGSEGTDTDNNKNGELAV
ncbi:flagellar hook capping FlgD N-terminal domain-containing protein [Clostridium sp. C105KSO13]|uniref:flagellar hook capping FlgD N-terminal domain-containing protein n=1 Tax=Clostridium sp. C105KSO13 TaxID=1776045 RepID=UPI000740857B|nr:flagellar hook capping FlgD N-terminal domain-containing protein [Clostridium sp. C105KSO13]CUX49256.1 flagellar basal body rod modification protein [Clostridium sp. C105KSO13]